MNGSQKIDIGPILKDPFLGGLAGKSRKTDDFEAINDLVAKFIVDGKADPDDIDGLCRCTRLSAKQVRTSVKQLRDRNRIRK